MSSNIWSVGNTVGSGSQTDTTVPHLAELFDSSTLPGGVISIACAAQVTYLVGSNGIVHSLGSGYIGNNKKSSYSTITPMQPLQSAKAKSVVANTHQNKNFVFVLMEDGSLFTLGNSADFRTGLGTEIDVLTPRFVDGFDSPVHQIVAGVTHAVAVTAKGSIYMWGRPFGYHADVMPTPTRQHSYETFFSENGEKLQQICAGESFTLFLTTSGNVYGLGEQDTHCLGPVPEEPQAIKGCPLLLPFEQNGTIVQMACGNNHVVCLTKSGRVIVWGMNKNGALGISDGSYDRVQSKPIELPSLPKCSYVHSSFYSSFAIAENGVVYGWGFNVNGNLGTKHTRNLESPEPVLALPPNDAYQGQTTHHIASGEYYSIFITSASKNLIPVLGQITLASATDQSNLPYPDLPEWMDGEGYDEPKVLSTGSIYGTGSEVDHSMVIFRPTKNLEGKGKPVSVAVGNKCSYVAMETGELYVWGTGYALGQGTEGVCKDPTKVWDLEAVKIVQCYASVDDVAFAITEKGSVYGWGRCAKYLHGTGQDYDAIHPRMLEGFKAPIKKLSISSTHVMALDRHGAVFLWGTGKALGNRNRSSIEKDPKKLQDQTFFAIDIAAGENVSFMLNDAGQILSWGEGLQGQLGHGSNKFASLPTAIKEIPERFISIAAGPDFCGAVSSGGNLYMWGNKESGLLDFMDPCHDHKARFYDRPQKTPKFSSSNLISLQLSPFNCFAINDKGGLYGWGEPHIGIGTGMTIKYPSRIESTQHSSVHYIQASDWQCLALAKPKSSLPPSLESPLKETATMISAPTSPVGVGSSLNLSKVRSDSANTSSSVALGDSVDDILQHEDFLKTLTDEVKFWGHVDREIDIATWCGRLPEIKEFLNRSESYHYPPAIVQSIVHAQKVIPAGEKVIKAWIMYSINFKDYESDRIIVITNEAIHRIKYNWTTLSVVHNKTFQLKNVYKVKIGRFANWNRTITSSLRSKVYEKQVGIQIWFQNPSTWKPPSFLQPFAKVKAPYITLRPAVNINSSSADDQDVICHEMGTALQCAIHSLRNNGKPFTLLHKFSRESPSKNNDHPPFPVRKVDSLQRYSGNGALAFVHNKFIAKTEKGFVEPTNK
ncbi:hypothetical protein SAMD00019534_083090 [Acytostelium subglobosum LB1]|uniref:hypothetical protein n=1 Tax=Acytostelium subglobosum LB1 TaxID=1410327 RepID=UPI0006451330|nr:hypothetical protein SAMD00019534_083090 [Acytostelium subglobosum LB1]GAM25134.1 hypothetical protein SAMD00019534_083090 [Acytostelium subglobosum LB1]|eukprot:XP_012751654.1 hypothetical protein SAMD00019534_083090 [Acytostelium subglobosum LB1]